MLLKKFLTFAFTFFFLFSSICDSALARAGGRSSFGGGRSSTFHSNQGSRGSRTYEGGNAAGKNYAPMQRSATAKNANPNSKADSQSANNRQNFQQPNQSPNFFQRNPFLSTFGAAIAGSWIGHMLFGGSGLGANNMNGVNDVAGQASSGGGMILNLLFIVIGAFAMIKLVKFLTKSQGVETLNNQPQFAENYSANICDIKISESENEKFAALLLEVQNAWSNQDIDKLKRLTAPEMTKYFSDALSQNNSQGIANKMENIEVVSVEVAESWKEDEMEYATVILEWVSLDYMINLNKSPSDFDWIIEGDNKNLISAAEAWTFTRYNSQANWILSAIAQVEAA
jgi:hypothetical protein